MTEIVDAPQDAMSPQTSYRLPPSDWRDADQYVFLGFVLHFYESQCACGAKASWSKPMRIFGHKTLVASRLNRKVPFESGWLPRGESMALYALPIEHTAVCHHCIGNYSATPGDVIELRIATDERNWLYTLMEDKRREQRAASEAKKPTAAKTQVADSDLLSL